MALPPFVLPTPETAHLALAPNWPNSHAVGKLLKEDLRRAMVLIAAHRRDFEAVEKHTPGKEYDVVTDVDHAAERILIKGALECFPGIGVIAEEPESLGWIKELFPNRNWTNLASGYLHLAPDLEGLEIYVIIDPLDGTKAFARRRRTGVASQIAIVAFINGRAYVLAAYIGDVLTGDIYGYRPGSNIVHRLSDLQSSEHLNDRVDANPLCKGLAVIRDTLDSHSETVQRLLAKQPHGLLKTHIVESGSMSLTYATLWTEAAMLVMRPFRETPWDAAPNIGICQKLGYVPLVVFKDTIDRYNFQLRTQPVDRHLELIWVHERRLPELAGWCNFNGISAAFTN